MSALKPKKNDKDISPGDDEGCNRDEEGDILRTVQLDRPRDFVFDESPTMGQACFCAKNPSASPEKSKRNEIHAFAIRDYGRKKQAQLLRFVNTIGGPLQNCLEY